MFDRLKARGYEIQFLSHAEAILGVDFPEAAEELEAALIDVLIPIGEIIAGGGGEAKGTQRLRRALTGKGWAKTTFVV
ncbi:MAG TPA: restriction endonuclease, partial [Acidiphilium sp.]